MYIESILNTIFQILNEKLNKKKKKYEKAQL